MDTPREREIAAEDSIRVVCRFRPLNDSEEKAGSKFVVKFPSGGDDNCISIGVSLLYIFIHFYDFFLEYLYFSVFTISFRCWLLCEKEC